MWFVFVQLRNPGSPQLEMQNNSDCTAFIVRVSVQVWVSIPTGNALAKPRRAMSVAQNIHAFLDEVFRDIFMR